MEILEIQNQEPTVGDSGKNEIIEKITSGVKNLAMLLVLAGPLVACDTLKNTGDLGGNAIDTARYIGSGTVNVGVVTPGEFVAGAGDTGGSAIQWFGNTVKAFTDGLGDFTKGIGSGGKVISNGGRAVNGLISPDKK